MMFWKVLFILSLVTVPVSSDILDDIAEWWNGLFERGAEETKINPCETEKGVFCLNLYKLYDHATDKDAYCFGLVEADCSREQALCSGFTDSKVEGIEFKCLNKARP
uniref:DUF19 domain-containing protein n=1 Tax=Caenorhabditis tropicalis TaxID=1561998 RepID=A0A1I7UWJ2_9PELO